MTTTVHYDETAPRKERFRVLRAADSSETRWITVESFATAKLAHAFAWGFTLGSQYGRRSFGAPDAHVTWDDDPERRDPLLVCDACGEPLCSVEERDSFDVLARVVADHRCVPARERHAAPQGRKS